MSLNARQRRFAEEYAVDHNATQAAIRAGYSEKTAGQQAHRLLKDVQIQELIEATDREASEAAGLNRQWVIEHLMQIADTGKTDSARVRALELLGKHQGMFAERLQHEGGIEIVVNGVPIESLQ